MTPLVKSLMRVKSRIAPSSKDRLAEVNRKISELISKNRRTLAKALVGSREWWKHVDNLSQRRTLSANVTMDNESLDELNNYFADLCTDDAYTKPVPAIVDKSLEAPQISERRAWNCLQHLKKTAMGPDLIPFWIWRDHAEIFTSIIHKIWNVSLKTGKWPSSWKRAHVMPLPKIDIPKGKQDFRGIKITPVIARAFEKSVYNTHARDIVEQHLSSTQFAYTTGGSCTDALLSMQYTIYSYLDEQDCKAVRVFAMDFSKAFDCVNHELLSSKLRQLPLNPLIVNWYLSFLEKRQQRVVYNGFEGQWREVNRGTTQGSVSRPYLFNVFINDLEINLEGRPALFKYADDSTIIVPFWGNGQCRTDLVDQFLSWSSRNRMTCNPIKCKEIIFRKKGFSQDIAPVRNIPQCAALSILGVTFQQNCKYSSHVRAKVIKANKSLFVLGSLRKEGMSQEEVDHLFNAIVLPNFSYALPVYGASDSDLSVIQNFLDRCMKRKFISRNVNIRDLLEKADKTLPKKIE